MIVPLLRDAAGHRKRLLLISREGDIDHDPDRWQERIITGHFAGIGRRSALFGAEESETLS